MIALDLTPRDIDALHFERFHHPQPRVRLRIEAVSLKGRGLLHQEICRPTRVTENTSRAYLRRHRGGGLERLKQADWDGPRSELSGHREALEEPFRDNPPRSAARAAAEIERITGLRPGSTPVRRSLRGLGLRSRKRGMIPAKADADEQPGFLRERLRPRLKRARRSRRAVRFGDAAHSVHGASLVLRRAAGARALGPPAVQCPGSDRRDRARVDDGGPRRDGRLRAASQAGGPLCGTAGDVGAGQRPPPGVRSGAVAGRRAGDRVAVPAVVLCPSGGPRLFLGWVVLDDGTADVPIAEDRPGRGSGSGRRIGRR